MHPKNLLFLLLSFISFFVFSQNKPSVRKTYTATKITKAPEIDGILNDKAWMDVPEAKNFVMVEPGDGDPIPPSHDTSVKIVYNDEAVFVAATLKEPHPERVLRQLTQRDNLNQAEFFLMDINTYDDGENQTRFIVTAAGTQADARITGNHEDFSYNLVWRSAVSQDENGWNVEMKIPYSALRFPKKEIQRWGIQLYREITHLNENYVWNYVDKSVGKLSQYNGLLKGIRNIDPPVRLSFYPYTSSELDFYKGKTQYNFSAGMDLKYGINESFTLDLTLVPDFGQTAYDKVELNLGPFEQIYDENRAFFTEGTELFNKGHLFYSRRVGSAPIGFNDAQKELLENEEIVENPDKTNLLNALKISGRTDRGLGIGFFNAVTQKAEAVFRDTLTGNLRRLTTEPLANYNIVVLDQRFNQNSSISLINTNVTRNGNFRDGNVTGFLFDIYNKSNSFNFEGDAKVSNLILPDQDLTGFASDFSIKRTKGNFRYRVSHEFANGTYNINDLGVNRVNNYSNFFGRTSYQIFEPRGIYNEYRIELFGRHRRRYRPNITQKTSVGGNFFAKTRTRFAFGGSFEIDSKSRDFFETRTEDQYVLYQPNGEINAWISSDYRKKFAYDLRVKYQKFNESPQSDLWFKIKPRFRVSKNFNLTYSFEFSKEQNRPSYVTKAEDAIVFGNRDQVSLENSIHANYNFNPKQGLNLSFRNFWATATYANGAYTSLQDHGMLSPYNFIFTNDTNPNTNFNIWNLDLSYRWRFAPGSEAVLLYRNSIFNQDSLSYLNYEESLNNLFEEPIRQNLSLRIVYYIDYNRIRSLFNS
ncbi:hydrolase [Christiangramia fulva]|uniref:Hydrolase n=1 Tax=Christiangramia fulva TaxID=2126553 RepID=A0A2R3Z828_9FLAO|nr:DUF5916 domain-containing protein [Christiangramia fulva]AVR46447.1 hydrolase [Christiangramia fulva]